MTDRPSGTRDRAVAFALIAGGGLLMVIIAGVPWYRVDDRASFTGGDLSGGLATIAGVITLAGVLLMLTLRQRGQKTTAVLVAAVAVITATALQASRPSPAEVVAELRRNTLADDYQLSWTGAGLGYALAAAAVLAGAVLTVARAGRWPSRAGRFERDAQTGVTSAEQDPTAIWKAIDAGDDPTVVADDRPADRSEPPSSGSGSAADR